MTEPQKQDHSEDVAGCACAAGPVFLFGYGGRQYPPALSWRDEMVLWRADAVQLCRELSTILFSASDYLFNGKSESAPALNALPGDRGTQSADGERDERLLHQSPSSAFTIASGSAFAFY